ncbi:LLM class flavin-dependent oxidoreductase [Rudaea sp.]|uniref:LLM class flavin-dependent oxidoreductase n=1 Tax=Rudaea sp. TaxID=2136325 RepID=UPI00321F8D83
MSDLRFGAAPLSVLDLSPICAGGTAAQSLANTLDLAQHAERLGYQRYWLAEHHNMPGIASAATSVVIGHVAAGTRTIRVGAGGIMLPNHAPLVVAEQFGTLATLFPDRIDLGLGRAPGTDQRTMVALRRHLAGDVDRFPQDVLELRAYFAAPGAGGASVRAIPGEDTQVPIWILGSSLYGAQLAAALGLPFAFASHFAPAELDNALALYRHRFKPSATLAQPHAMAALNVFAADSDAEARRLFTSQQQAFLNLRRGVPGQLPAPIDDIHAFAAPQELAMLEHALACSVVGTRDAVRAGVADFLARTQADELIVTAMIHDHDARRRSFEILADAARA